MENLTKSLKNEDEVEVLKEISIEFLAPRSFEGKIRYHYE